MATFHKEDEERIMAETRKFNPNTSAIGDAVREALGDIRPITPGIETQPTTADQASNAEQSSNAPQTVGSLGATVFAMDTLPDFLTRDSDEIA